MKHLFVPYEIALRLKELGFDEPCLSAYRNADGEQSLMQLSKWTNSGEENTHDGYCAAPLYQQVVDWLRDEHKLALTLTWAGRSGDGTFTYWGCQIHHAVNGLKAHINKTHYYEYEVLDGRKVGGMMTYEFKNMTYYEALTKAIEEALKLLP